MSESPLPHSFQNPRLADLHAFFVAVQKVEGGDQQEPRHGIISAAKQTWRGDSPVDRLFELQNACAWATARIVAGRGAPSAKQIHQDQLDRAREMLLALQGSSKWSDFKTRAAHIPNQLVLLDEFLGPDVLDERKAKEFSKTTLTDIAVLLNAVANDADLPVELKEIVLGQLGLLERSVSRFTTMGFVSFQEVVELSYGKLSLALVHTQEPNTLKRVKQILDFLLKVHSAAEMSRDAVKLLQHIPIKALPAPSEAADQGASEN